LQAINLGLNFSTNLALMGGFDWPLAAD